MPVDQSSYEREVSLRISAPNASGCWDPSNDYSYQGVSSREAKTPYITVYYSEILIFGIEPDGTEPGVTNPPNPASIITIQPTLEPTPPPIQISVSTMPPQETIRGDVDEDGGIDIIDAFLIAQFYVGIIAELPPS